MCQHALLSLSIVALSLLPTHALAQARPLPAFDIQRLQLDPGALGSLVVGTGRTLPQGILRASLNVHYEELPLSFDEQWDPAAGTGLVEGKFTTHLTAAYGVLSWLQVEAQVPFILGQEGSRLVNALPPARNGLGTPWLGARAGLLSMPQGAPLNLAVDLSAGLPVGSASALARDDFSAMPRLQVGFQGAGYQLGTEVGLLLRSKRDISDISGRDGDVAGNELRVGATVTSLGGRKTRGEVSALLGVPLAGGRVSLEALLAIRRHVLPWMDLYVLGGPGLGPAMDTPSYRVLAGASFSNAKID